MHVNFTPAVILAAAALAACNPEGMHQGQPSQASTATISTAAGSVSGAGRTAAAVAAAPGQKPIPAAAIDTTTKAPPAAAGKLHLRMASGRTKQDSSSFYGAVRSGMKSTKWPAPEPPPLPGSILPGKRIVAFYGNPLSKKMGVLGEYPTDQMLAKLDQTVAEWRQADPSLPVQPALHLIAVVAQGAPGRDGMYRLRMDTALIEKVYGWARSKNAILFLDIQAGHSTLQAELPRLLPFLSRPDVHLAVDPEFFMHYDHEGMKPGTKIGTMMAADVNYCVRTLTDLVKQKNIPPKILVVHRFTKRMVPDAEDIKPASQVQVVMDMDGWGPPWLKFDSYRDYEVNHPVEFTGFKIFFHNDVKKGFALIQPFEVLQLVPKPLYIQYQ